MKNNYLIIFSVLFSLLILNGCVSYRSAQNFGDKQFNLGRYYTAVVAYEKSYSAKPSYEKAQKIAKTYTILKDYDNAKKWWERVISYGGANSDDYNNYVTALFQTGSAGSYNIDSIVTVSKLNPDQFNELKRTVGLIKNNPKIKLVQEERFNQNKSAEAGIFVDNKERYFISTNGTNNIKSVNVKKVRLDKGSKYSKEYLDFNNNPYFKIKISQSGGSWSDLKLDLKNVQQTGSFALNEKDQMAFITVFRNLDNYEKRTVSLNSELYYGKIDNSYNISNPKPFPLNKPFEYSILSPFVDEANKLLYFSSDMPGGKGGLDLYVVAFNENYDFSTPVNLGSGINSSRNESFPFIKDGILYFSSDGHVGLGGLDIFSSRISGNTYELPENIGRPFNSSVDDFSFIITQKNEQYLISNRGSNYGVDQIYKVTNADFTIEIYLGLGPFSKEDLDSIKVYNSKGEQIHDFIIEDNTIKFKINEPGEFIVLKNGSLPQVFKVTADQLKDGSEVKFKSNFKSLNQLAVFEDIVYFDFNKSEIRPSDKVILNRINDYLLRNEFLNLDISAHTDSKANQDYNLQLSEKRAKAVVNYLQGFNKGATPSNSSSSYSSSPQNVQEINGVFYTVQILAGSQGLITKVKNDDAAYNYEKVNSDLYRISKGRFSTSNEANNFSKKMIAEGYTDAFPVAYYGGERYTLKEINKVVKRESLVSTSYDSGSKGSTPVINNNRISTQWFGKQSPLVDCVEGVDCDDQAHQLNRRAELKLYLNQYFDLSLLPIQDLINNSSTEEDLIRIIRRRILNMQD